MLPYWKPTFCGLGALIVSVVSDMPLPWVDFMRKPFVSKSGKTFLPTNPKKQKAKKEK